MNHFKYFGVKSKHCRVFCAKYTAAESKAHGHCIPTHTNSVLEGLKYKFYTRVWYINVFPSLPFLILQFILIPLSLLW